MGPKGFGQRGNLSRGTVRKGDLGGQQCVAGLRGQVGER